MLRTQGRPGCMYMQPASAQETQTTMVAWWHDCQTGTKLRNCRICGLSIIRPAHPTHSFPVCRRPFTCTLAGTAPPCMQNWKELAHAWWLTAAPHRAAIRLQQPIACPVPHHTASMPTSGRPPAGVASVCVHSSGTWPCALLLCSTLRACLLLASVCKLLLRVRQLPLAGSERPRGGAPGAHPATAHCCFAPPCCCMARCSLQYRCWGAGMQPHARRGPAREGSAAAAA